MTLEEFKKRAAEDNEWAPGWEAIDAVFDSLYPGQNPAHFATPIERRAMFGGDQYLDGISLFDSPNGYKHLIT